MTLYSFPQSLWMAVANPDERSQRLVLAQRIGGIRWLCILAGIVACRSHSHLSVMVFGIIALYNVLPFIYAARCGVRQLRLVGAIFLVLDGIALLIVSLPLLPRHEYPLPLVLLFFAASIRLGYEPPAISTAVMVGITTVASGFGISALRFGENAQDVLLWVLLCVFLGWRGTLVARNRWRERQKLWAQHTCSDDHDVDAHANTANRIAEGGAIPNPLTEREREVLTLIAQGKTNEEIADVLCISRKTVGTHAESIHRKLQVRNRIRAVMVALENGWMPLPVNTPESECETAISPQSLRDR